MWPRSLSFVCAGDGLPCHGATAAAAWGVGPQDCEVPRLDRVCSGGMGFSSFLLESDLLLVCCPANGLVLAAATPKFDISKKSIKSGGPAGRGRARAFLFSGSMT